MALGPLRSRRSITAVVRFARGRARTPLALGCLALFLAGAAVCGALLLIWSASSALAAIPSDLQSVHLYGDVKSQVDSLSSQADSVQADVDALDAKLEGFTESYDLMQTQLTDVNTQMTDLRRELRAAETDHAYRVKKFNERICALYKSGGNDELLSLLLEANGVDDLIQRVRLIATLADQDKHVVDGLNESTEKLNKLLDLIDEKKAEELSLRTQIEGQRQQIEASLNERQQTLANLDSQMTTLIQQEQKRQQDEQARLKAALAARLNGGQIYDGPLPQTDSEILNQFIETAAYYVGIPYVWAGDRPSTGFDCSGFTAYVYAQHGVNLPHYSGYQAQMGYPVSGDQIQPGDLVAFGYPVHHVGIYIGDDLFIHAAGTGDVVKISYLSERSDLAAIRRFDLQPRTGEPALW